MSQRKEEWKEEEKEIHFRINQSHRHKQKYHVVFRIIIRKFTRFSIIDLKKQPIHKNQKRELYQRVIVLRLYKTSWYWHFHSLVFFSSCVKQGWGGVERSLASEGNHWSSETENKLLMSSELLQCSRSGTSKGTNRSKLCIILNRHDPLNYLLDLILSQGCNSLHWAPICSRFLWVKTWSDILIKELHREWVSNVYEPWKYIA